MLPCYSSVSQSPNRRPCSSFITRGLCGLQQPHNSLFPPALHTPPLKHSFQHGTRTQVLMMPSYLEQLNLNNHKPPSTDPWHLFLKAEFFFRQISCALKTRLSHSLFTKSTLQAHSPIHAFAHALKPFSSSHRPQALALLSAAQLAPFPLALAQVERAWVSWSRRPEFDPSVQALTTASLILRHSFSFSSAC